MKPDSDQAADESTRTHISGRGDNLDTVTSPQSAKQDFTPESFGHFELLEMIGYGGMGVVYRAKDTRLGREVALKKLLGAAADHPVLRGRFETEAKAIARLHHPNLMPILEYGQVNKQPYFTMPLLSGVTLAERIGDYQKEPRRAVELMVKVARAVQHAHENQILHRDLKPSNILFDDKDEPIVADFGVAKLVDAGADLTATGAVLGTPAYMSPEQAAGRLSEISARSDIWTLGVLLYELVVGERPFRGATREEVTPQILTDIVPSPILKVPTLDETLARIILKCLQKRPDDRYQSAGRIAEDLQRWLDGQKPQVKLPSRISNQRRLLWLILPAMALLLAGFWLTGPRSELDPLVDANGRLHQPVWVTPEVPLRTDAESKTITIRSEGRTFLQLASNVRAKRFRYRAQVRVNQALKPGAAAGIFIGGSTHSNGTENVFCCLALDLDRFGFERQDVPMAANRCYPVAAALPTGAALVASQDVHKYPMETLADGWCPLIWEIDTDNFVAKRGDQIVCAKSSGEFQGLFRLSKMANSTLNVQNLYPQFSSSNAIGVCIYNSDASFRDIGIELLP
ncbi:MAG TPA: serine/threonine-protein kinase [Gemmataceae bacterium]|nr:serine/threonine-protein kinase [Gemmataceae bacterium]